MVAVADVVGAIPIKDLVFDALSANCQYGNDRVYGCCRPSATLPGGAPAGSFKVSPAGASTNEAYLSPNSTVGFVIIAENTVTETTKLAANAVASNLALSQLDCFYESPALTLFCGADTSAALPSASKFNKTDGTSAEFGDGRFGTNSPKDYVHTTSKGFKIEDPTATATIPTPPTNPVELPYGAGRSGASPEEALRDALFIGLGQLDCFFFNKIQTAYCPGEGGTPPAGQTFADGAVASAVTPKDRFPSSVSQADADTVAELVAKAALVCLYTHPEAVTRSTCPSVESPIPIQNGVVPARTIISPKDTADATTIAEALAASMVVCTGADAEESAKFSSPFGVSVAPNTSGCCKIKMIPGGATSLTSLWTCLSGNSPTMGPVSCQGEALDVNQCAVNGYLYLVAVLTRTEDGVTPDTEWTIIGDPTIVWSTTALDDLTEEGGGNFTARRVIAEIATDGHASCRDTQILQSISAPQKVTSSLSEDGAKIPVIVDLNTPSGIGGSPAGCDNFRLITRTSGGAVTLYRTAGSAGNITEGEVSIGPLSSNHNKYLYAKFTLSGDTYTTDVVFGGSQSSSATVQYVLLAHTGPGGELYKDSCSASATVCRDWFVSPATYSLSSSGV